MRRASLKDSYQFILDDLDRAAELLELEEDFNTDTQGTPVSYTHLYSRTSESGTAFLSKSGVTVRVPKYWDYRDVYKRQVNSYRENPLSYLS